MAWDWAKILLLILGLLKWVADRIAMRDAEDLGRKRAEEEGRNRVEDFSSRIDDADPDSVSDGEILRRDP